MVADRFQHLHVHSHYSLLDGVCTIPQLVGSAAANGMKALALTDHGNMYGAVEFHHRCKEAGIKPIIGMEAYITAGSRFEKSRSGDGSSYYHLVLLVENEIGYHNLLKLSSTAFVDGFYYKPRIDHEALAAHSEGLIGLSACLSSEVNRALLHGDDAKAEQCARRYMDLFAKDRFFLEIQDHGLAEQKRVLEKVPDLARRLGLPLVATNDIHYLTRKDARAQEVHLCINTGTTMDDQDRMTFDTDQFFFRSGAEMYELFADFPEAITNTDEIAALCTFEIPTDNQYLPVFQGADLTDEEAAARSAEQAEEDNRLLFRKIVEEGFAERYPEPTPEIRERLEYEVGVIEKMGFISYFLITWDFIRYAREMNVPVGPGRGSAVGSIVSFCMGITDLCPIEYDLIFERFLNSDRISMPDIDIDFCMDGREQVIEYVREKYGDEKVCQIVTFGTMAAKAVLRDVGRALGIPLKEIDAIAKKVPDTLGIKLQEAIDQEPQLAEWAKDERYRELFEVGLRLEGLNRHCSTHAAGVVICDRPLTEVIPLQRNGDDITTQFPMEILEGLGLLKMDFLGLRTLTIIDRALKIIEEETGERIEIGELPLDDGPTYELLQNADTTGVFQLESSGMRELLRNMQPDRFEDVIAVLALYRPGPLGSGMHNTFCDRKHGREQVEYIHDALAPILGSSNGVILYQEQVMRIAHDLAGFSMNEADSLRKAMGKKKPEILARFKKQFADGAEGNGIPRRSAEEIFEQIEHFAKYGFNKSHSTAYALISYQTAWLKANHTEAFIAAVMSCYITTVDKMVEYVEEARRLGIEVLTPSVNASGHNFTVKDGRIIYGLVALKGVGSKAVEAILDERRKGGEFTSLFDLCARVDLKAVNKTVLEQLISAGALDGLGPSRARMSAAVKEAIDEGQRVQAEKRAGQLSLFGGEGGEPQPATESYPEVPDWSELERLSAEKGSLGFYLTGHPLDRRDGELRPFRTHLIRDLAPSDDGQKLSLGLMIQKVRQRQTKRGEPMAIVHAEDRTGAIEVVIFPKIYAEVAPLLAEDGVIIVTGVAEVTEDRTQIRADQITPLGEACRTMGRRVGLRFDVESTTEDLLFRVKDLLRRNRGDVPTSLIFDGPGDHRWVIRSDENLSVSPSLELLAELRAAIGEESVLIDRG
jgi:DNA polymerase-3 subunit alpha